MGYECGGYDLKCFVFNTCGTCHTLPILPILVILAIYLETDIATGGVDVEDTVVKIT